MFKYEVAPTAVHINLDMSGKNTDIVFHYNDKSFVIPGDSFFLVTGCESHNNEILSMGYLIGRDMLQFVSAPRFE